MRHTTAPSAWPANRPVSKVKIFSGAPLVGADTLMESAMCRTSFPGARRPIGRQTAPASSQVSSTRLGAAEWTGAGS
jgi:hypothetical protein